MNPDANDIQGRLNELFGLVTQVLDVVQRPSHPRWETVPHAVRTRRVGRRAIMKLIVDGKIRVQQVPAQGGFAYNVSVDDLEEIYPVRKK